MDRVPLTLFRSEINDIKQQSQDEKESERERMQATWCVRCVWKSIILIYFFFLSVVCRSVHKTAMDTLDGWLRRRVGKWDGTKKAASRNVFSYDCPKRNSCGRLNSRVVMDKSLLDRHSIQQLSLPLSYRRAIISSRLQRKSSLYYVHKIISFIK